MKRKFYGILGLLLLATLVGGANADANGSLPTSVFGKLQSHVTSLPTKIMAGVLGLGVFCGGYACLPQELAAAEQSRSEQQSIVQSAAVDTTPVEGVKTEIETKIEQVHEIITKVDQDGHEISARNRLLWLAAYFGDLPTVERSVSEKLYDDYRKYARSIDNHPLIDAMRYAIIGGQLDVVAYLLPQGDNNLPNFLEWRLLEAVEHEQWDIVHYLASHRAEFHQAIIYATKIESTTAIQQLRAAGVTIDDLNLAMREAAGVWGDLSGVKFLHTAGADDLNAALLEAAYWGRLAIMKYLLAQGADALNAALLETVGSVGTRPPFNTLETVKLLVAEGADDIAGALRVLAPHTNSLSFSVLQEYLLSEL